MWKENKNSVGFDFETCGLDGTIISNTESDLSLEEQKIFFDALLKFYSVWFNGLKLTPAKNENCNFKVYYLDVDQKVKEELEKLNFCVE